MLEPDQAVGTRRIRDALRDRAGQRCAGGDRDCAEDTDRSVAAVRNEGAGKIQSIDFAAARADGLANLDQVIATYPHEISLSDEEMKEYLNENIIFTIDEEMRKGLTRYFELAQKHGLIDTAKPTEFLG